MSLFLFTTLCMCLGLNVIGILRILNKINLILKLYLVFCEIQWSTLWVQVLSHFYWLYLYFSLFRFRWTYVSLQTTRESSPTPSLWLDTLYFCHIDHISLKILHSLSVHPWVEYFYSQPLRLVSFATWVPSYYFNQLR